jgi:hypothetical protein
VCVPSQAPLPHHCHAQLISGACIAATRPSKPAADKVETPAAWARAQPLGCRALLLQSRSVLTAGQGLTQSARVLVRHCAKGLNQLLRSWVPPCLRQQRAWAPSTAAGGGPLPAPRGRPASHITHCVSRQSGLRRQGRPLEPLDACCLSAARQTLLYGHGTLPRCFRVAQRLVQPGKCGKTGQGGQSQRHEAPGPPSACVSFKICR